MDVRPFLKWPGGKFRQLSFLREHLPQHTKRYVEPFVGAGAVALNMDYPECIIGDINPDLMLVWRVLQKYQETFMEACKALFVPENNQKEVYYALREEFNITDDLFRKAALFVYLNRHGFNGLCRYNKEGLYNTAFGGPFTTVYYPEVEFRHAIQKLRTFQIMTCDFTEMFSLVEEGDVVYCDPPFLPIKADSFTAYSPDAFTMQNHIDLAMCAAKACKRGATVLISNSSNSFVKELYQQLGATMVSLMTNRSDISGGKKRQSTEELLVIFKKR